MRHRIDPVVRRELIRIWIKFYQLENGIMAAFDRLEASMAVNTTVSASIVELLTKLSQDIRDIGGAKAAALADSLEANNASLTAAILANTPVASEPIPTV